MEKFVAYRWHIKWCAAKYWLLEGLLLCILAACSLFFNLLLYILDTNKGDFKISFIYSSSLHVSVWLCRPQVNTYCLIIIMFLAINHTYYVNQSLITYAISHYSRLLIKVLHKIACATSWNVLVSSLCRVTHFWRLLDVIVKSYFLHHLEFSWFDITPGRLW